MIESDGDAASGPEVVYDAAVLRRQVQRLRRYLDRAYPDSHVFYALKACYLAPVVRRLVDLGCGLEIMSSGERAVAAALGVEGERIVWNGPALDVTTLERIVDRGEWVNVDSRSVFDRLVHIARARGRTVEAGVRLNLSGEGKLGVAPDEIGACLDEPSVSIVGVHFHHGAAGHDVDDWVDGRLRMLDVAMRWEREAGVTLRYVDLGGGLQARIELGEQLDPIIERLWDLRSVPRLFVEPGAFLVGPAATATTRVVTIKTVGGRRWAITDLGASFLVPLDRARFEVESARQNEPGSVSVAGPFCYEADVIARDRSLDIQEGDRLTIHDCGAYTASMMSGFGAVPPRLRWRSVRGVEPIGAADPARHWMAAQGYEPDCSGP